VKTSIRSRLLWLSSAAVFSCVAIFAQAPKATDTKAPAAPVKPAAPEDSGVRSHASEMDQGRLPLCRLLTSQLRYGAQTIVRKRSSQLSLVTGWENCLRNRMCPFSRGNRRLDPGRHLCYPQPACTLFCPTAVISASRRPSLVPPTLSDKLLSLCTMRRTAAPRGMKYGISGNLYNFGAHSLTTHYK